MVEMDFDIRSGDLDNVDLRQLLSAHLDHAATHSPRESIHALNIEELRATDVTLWTIWNGETLQGCGALRELDTNHGEIKSMHTLSDHRRKGVAAHLLAHILGEAKRRSYRRVSLETGSMDGFAPARGLYERFGFRVCAPFADYSEDPNSVCMTLEL